MKKRLLGIILAVIMTVSLTSQAVCLHASDDSKKSGVITVNYTAQEEPKDTAPETAAGEPVIMDFSTLVTLYNTVKPYETKDNAAGSYTFVTLDDGTKCMRLKYDKYGDALEDYRIMFAPLAHKKLTADHKYMRVKYMTTETSFEKLALYNNGKRTEAVLDGNTAQNAGEWVISAPSDISAAGLLERFLKGMHCTLQFTSDNENAEIYIKEIGIFTSKKQAYEYYGDSGSNVVNYSVMTFGENGNGNILKGENYGNSEINNEKSAVDITYAETTNFWSKEVKYMTKLRFNTKGSTPAENRFVRVLYSAKNPEGTVGASLFVFNDGNSRNEIFEIQKNLVDTDGKYVLSDTVCFTEKMMTRFAGTMHCSFCTTAANPGGEYSIKAIYFFPTREAAESFDIDDIKNEYNTITIKGNDISKYKIVIPEGLAASAMSAVKAFAEQINTVSGVDLEIVYDDTPETEYEIMIGTSARAQSTKPLEGFDLAADDYRRYGVGFDKNDLIIAAAEAHSISEAVETFINGYLKTDADDIDINESMTFTKLSSTLKHSDYIYSPSNVETPNVFSEDFDSDDGYFTEENGEDNWKYENGTYRASATDGLAVSYVHVYEANVDYTASVKFADTDKNGEFGLILRYVSADAYVKVGYDIAAGEWYIDSREGTEFYRVRGASKKATLTAGKEYILNVIADGENITLTVDGTEILTAKTVHVIPGRFGVYADSSNVTVDDITCVLMSGEGTVMKNTVHYLLTPTTSGEGGSAFEMSDGSLFFQIPQNGRPAYRSTDDGKTWVKTDRIFDGNGKYLQVMRLSNGDFLQIINGTLNGEECMYSRTSSDDGKTWVDGGRVCGTKFDNTSAVAGNMNDKLFQSATTGRIFYSQNYSASSPIDGKSVFCVFYYSDDNGMTWKESETASWEIEGNEDIAYFGECKILECADGTLRVYGSWNDYDCVVYSESKDNGVTWGPIERIPELFCAKSSMQFCRDPYADNDTTYYMVWVYSESEKESSIMNRFRLSLAKTTDGKNWTYLGDLWRWESPYVNAKSNHKINQVVDPCVFVSENAIIVGSGISEKLPPSGDIGTHSYQQQNLWAIDRDSLPEGKPMNGFTDVKVGAAYYDAVTFVTEEGLFNGTSETTFAPDTTMNRAMFVTVLGRLDGADVSKYTAPTFSDVIAGQWYTSYVEWAAANGIVNGVGNGLYGIDGAVTVEQACTILYRYANGKSGTASNAKLTDFDDLASVSAWAADGVKWAVENGIYSGQNGSLCPTASATRALVASMFRGYVLSIGE